MEKLIDDTKKKQKIPSLKISIEGNIASGKSKFLHLLRERGLAVVQEPIQRWQNVGSDNQLTFSQQRGQNLLGLFYNDPLRWAFTFQSYAFLSRMKNQMNPDLYIPKEVTAIKDPFMQITKRLKADFGASDSEDSHGDDDNDDNDDINLAATVEKSHGKSKSKLNNNNNNNEKRASEQADSLFSSALYFERSVFSDRYIFGDNCFETGLMNPVEYGIYQELHTWLIKTFGGLQIDAFVYLRCSPDTAMARLKKRGREEESSVSLEYLTQLHQRHEKWLNSTDQDSLPEQLRNFDPNHILVLNVEDDFLHDKETQNSLLAKLQTFVESLVETK